MSEILGTLKALARTSLPLWGVPDAAKVRLLNVSENATYLIETDDRKAVLRIHRSGYHDRQAIESELAWLDALTRDTTLLTPTVWRGRNGEAIQTGTVPDLEKPRFMVMFDFIEGEHPKEDADLTDGFRTLGQIAAETHQHVATWEKPRSFKRFSWDFDAVFGPEPTWGRWQDAPGITPDIHTLLARVEATLGKRLTAYGMAPDRYNLIHADMRLANLLLGPDGTRLIDFDDCGFGWLLYDFAAAISFIEDDPRIPELKAAWLDGYRSRRALAPEDEAEIESFVMLRRMALLAWIGSHMEAPEPQALAPDFAVRTAHLAERWLTEN